MPRRKFPVNIAAGALLAVVGGIIMNVLDFPLGFEFGLRLVAFFILGALVAYFVRKVK